MKKITVFFDFETWMETPVRGGLDIVKTIRGITSVLDKHRVRAVFNTCGAIAEEYPELIKDLHYDGHEIASHGYKHEGFDQLLAKELHAVLERTEKAIFKVIKEKPIGVRAPWVIHNKKIYEVFRQRGYKWASNHYPRFPEMFRTPNSSSLHRILRMIAGMRLVFEKKRPYYDGGLLEIPLMSSLEMALLGNASAYQDSPEKWLRSAFENLKRQYIRSEEHFNLNFHPWFIGSGNRLILLDKILGYINSKKGNRFVLAKELVGHNKL